MQGVLLATNEAAQSATHSRPRIAGERGPITVVPEECSPKESEVCLLEQVVWFDAWSAKPTCRGPG
jgi:hypothetical protein